MKQGLCKYENWVVDNTSSTYQNNGQ